MLKFADVKIGVTRIRAYDFKPMKGRDDNYLEGTIVKVVNEPYYAFIVKVDSEYPTDHTDRIGKNILVPIEVSFMEYEERITILK